MKRIVSSIITALIIALSCLGVTVSADGADPIDTTPYEPVDTTPAYEPTTPIPTTPALVPTTPPIQQTAPPATTLLSCRFCGQYPCACTVQMHTDPTEPPQSTPDNGVETPPLSTFSSATSFPYEAVPGDPFGQTEETTSSTSSTGVTGGTGSTGGGIPPAVIGILALTAAGAVVATPFIMRAVQLKKIYTY